MMTLRRFTAEPPDVPMSAVWYLADLGEAKGRQELFTRQSPQRLRALREHATIESAVSSNRIEGVEIDASRVRAVVLGKPVLRDRNEEEVRGYRDALKLIHASAGRLVVSEPTLLDLHRLSRGRIGDAGQYKRKDIDIIETYPDGRSRVRFKTVPAKRTSAAMGELLSLGADATEERRLHPLLAVAAFNLDFLCIHPFRDGNGRVSRLLLLLQWYHLGFEVGRYISIERIIEQNKDRYYETLEQSSQGWHEGQHDPWPYLNYLLYILKEAYRELEDRLGQVKTPRGEKSEVVLDAIHRAEGDFSVADLQRKCPGVSIDRIRHMLKRLREEGELEYLGRGRSARWRRPEGEMGNRGGIG
ncbi:MAG TPA: Fic family protein [Thermoanaerobaculia bacterium]|nr:Fic family protein [Thermoanaerobaculia bacterium]